jgi:hypothetical protein
MTIRRALRSLLCLVVNGRHEFYQARTVARVFQRCLLCGHETRGWDVSITPPKAKAR